MPISFACGRCGQRYRFADALAGRATRCKKCGDALRVPPADPAGSDVWYDPAAAPARPASPAPSPASSDVWLDDDPPPAPAPVPRRPDPARVPRRPAPPPTPSPPPTTADVFDFDDSETLDEDAAPPLSRTQARTRPTASRPKRRIAGTGDEYRGMLLHVGVLLILFGVILLFFGRREKILSSPSSSTPQEVTLAELIGQHEQKTIPNNHVVVRDLRFATDFVGSKKAGSGSSWETIWVPVTPADGSPPGPIAGPVRAIVRKGHVYSQEHFEQLAARTSFQGMVINSISSLSGDQQRLLAQGFPGSDFSNCLMIDDGRRPTSAVLIFLMIAVGGLGIVGGIAMNVARGVLAYRDGRLSNYQALQLLGVLVIFCGSSMAFIHLSRLFEDHTLVFDAQHQEWVPVMFKLLLIWNTPGIALAVASEVVKRMEGAAGNDR